MGQVCSEVALHICEHVHVCVCLLVYAQAIREVTEDQGQPCPLPGEACPGPRLSQFREPGAATGPNPTRWAPFPLVTSLPQVLDPGLGARRPELRSCWRWRWRWRRPTTHSGVPRFLSPRGCFIVNHSQEGEGPLWRGSRRHRHLTNRRFLLK